MEFAQPERLAFLLLLPLLYLLSLPQKPKRTQVTAHLAQWLAAQRRLTRRPVRFRWLRFLLLVGAFLAVVVAHTGPRFAGRPGAADLVILLDTSASMAAAGGGFDRARAVVTGLLESVPEHVDVRLGLCGADVRVVRGTRSELRLALAELDPGGPGTVDFEVMATELLGPTTAVLTLTDGMGPTRPPTVGALQLVGEPLGNVGIVACAVDDAWPLPEITVRLRVVNHAATDRAVVVSLAGGIVATAAQRFELGSGRTAAVEFKVQRDSGGRLAVRISPAAGAGSAPLAAMGDGLERDDVVVIELPPPPRPEIVVRAEGEPTRALAAVARALAVECGGTVVTDVDTARAGFLLMEGGVLAEPPTGSMGGLRMLSFGTAFGAITERSTPGRALDWHRTHPVTSGLDLSDLVVDQALQWTHSSGPAGEVLIQDGERPLAVLRGGPDWASVHLAFELGDSNLFKLAAFPQLIRRCFAAAYGRRAEPVIATTALLNPAESNLARSEPRPADRALPPFSVEPSGLAVAFLILGLLLLAVRVYV